MNDCPCTSSTYKCETSDDLLLTLGVALTHKLLANPLGYAIRSNIQGTELPFLPNLITPFMGETFRYTQSFNSNSNGLILTSV